MKIDKITQQRLFDNKRRIADHLGIYVQVVNRWIKSRRISPVYKKLVNDFLEKKI